jgi:hypothetical protein
MHSKGVLIKDSEKCFCCRREFLSRRLRRIREEGKGDMPTSISLVVLERVFAFFETLRRAIEALHDILKYIPISYILNPVESAGHFFVQDKLVEVQRNPKEWAEGIERARERGRKVNQTGGFAWGESWEEGECRGEEGECRGEEENS